MISNKIFTADTRCPLDLQSPTLTRLSQYRAPQGRFPGGILKLNSGTFLLFKTGKVVVNGVKDEPDELEFLLLTEKQLHDVKLSHCSAYMNCGPLDLQRLSQRVKSIYEPELHPGMLVHIGKVSVIMYHTGSVIICGCKNEQHAADIESKVLELINVK